jgi:N-6 DNA Methylase family protein
LQKREISENSWTVKGEDLKNFDLSAKNPNKIKEEIIRNPEEIISEIEKNNLEITKLVSELKNIL